MLPSGNDIPVDMFYQRILVGIADAGELIHLIDAVSTRGSGVRTHGNRLAAAEDASAPAGHDLNEVVMGGSCLYPVKKVCSVLKS